jgi:hypothetical protein
MLVAIPWIVWHAPTFFLDTGYRGALNPLILPGFLIAMLAGAIVLIWIYEGAGASILLAALWHTALNLGSATRGGEGLLAVLVSSPSAWPTTNSSGPNGSSRIWRRDTTCAPAVPRQ